MSNFFAHNVFENIVGIGENHTNQHFILLPHCFLPLLYEFLCLFHIYLCRLHMLSILSSVKELNLSPKILPVVLFSMVILHPANQRLQKQSSLKAVS